MDKCFLPLTRGEFTKLFATRVLQKCGVNFSADPLFLSRMERLAARTGEALPQDYVPGRERVPDLCKRVMKDLTRTVSSGRRLEVLAAAQDPWLEAEILASMQRHLEELYTRLRSKKLSTGEGYCFAIAAVCLAVLAVVLVVLL